MRQEDKKSINQYLRFSGIALQMGALIGAAAYLGVWLDEKYPNDFSGFTVGCSLLGVFVSMYLVIKQVQQISKKN
ncbi:AtpZ/AtpI family protein [Flavobacterium sp. JP2137]|uniref:AtpZ/AtpI family protein n=1 Tax=Flavobacterium sp. JP2137 TaxID=3414510 RepID=UPI003D2FC94E